VVAFQANRLVSLCMSKDTMSKKKVKHSTVNEVAVENIIYLPLVLSAFEQQIYKSKCYLCDGAEDEDMIVLCDGEGCENEAHMYCLDPVLTEVPEGDWLCDYCDKKGTSRMLRQYFNTHRSTHYIPPSKCLYQIWLDSLQMRFTKHNLNHSMITNGTFKSELTSDIGSLIGLTITLLVDETSGKYHTGRIIDVRGDNKELPSRSEHLVQFNRYVMFHIS
jgi:hypothetical protein